MLFSLGATPISCETSAGLSSLFHALFQVKLSRSPALIQVAPSRSRALFIVAPSKSRAQLIAAPSRPRYLIQVAMLRSRALFRVAPSRSCAQLIVTPLRSHSLFQVTPSRLPAFVYHDAVKVTRSVDCPAVEVLLSVSSRALIFLCAITHSSSSSRRIAHLCTVK
jgi:hypothetical protein